MKKKALIAKKILRAMPSSIRRALDRHALKKASQTAMENRSELDASAEQAEVMLNRLNSVSGLKNPEEYRRIARVLGAYASANRAVRDQARKKGDLKRAELFEKKMKYLRKKTILALTEAQKSEELLDQKRKKMGFD